MPLLRHGKLAGIISISDAVKYRLDDLVRRRANAPLYRL